MADITSRLADLSPEKHRLLALKLKQKAAAAAAAAEASAGHGGGERPSEFPASFAQRRMWLLDSLEPGSTAYSMPRVWRVPGPLDAAVLERAVDELARRHETLRTHLEERGGELVQVVAPPAPFRLEVTDLSALSPDQADAELERLARADASTPFRLAEGPLFRASLVRLAADEHALLWNLHHAVTDGWSTGILARELKALYQVFSRGEPSPLAPLPLQYGDHALRERERLSGGALERLLGFWRGALEGAPTRLEIAPDRPRPPVRTYRGASVTASLGDDLPARVDALARAHDATPFMVYLAAFQLLLGRYARQDEVLVGTAIANRASADVEGIVGFFVNTLVLRGDLTGDPTFAALLGRVREATLGAYEHQALPFEKLVEELNPERSLSHAPLVQAVIVLHNQHSVGGGLAAAPGPAADALRLEARGGAEEEARFDLSLDLAQGPNGARARLSYATDFLEEATARRMLGHLGTLLDAAVRAPETAVSALPLMDDAERAALDAWNDTARDLGPAEGIHRAVSRAAARTPGARALAWEGGSMTYAEMEAAANRLARRLGALGVAPGARVGVALERGPELVVSLLAVLKAGAAYVPLDPEYPAERLAYMLEDSGVPVLITASRLLDRVPSGGAHHLLVDADAEAIAAESPTPPEVADDPDREAYVIYTSGSTGRPKGAANAHRGVLNRLRWMQAEYALAPEDAVLQKTTFSFDVSVWELFWPLMTGARLVLARPGGHRDPAYLAEVIAREGVTTLHFVPSMLSAFLEGAPDGAFAGVRRVVCSGEALPAELVERFHARAPKDARLHNLYGPTEAAIDVTFFPCERGDERRVIPIGRPVANTRIHVLDPRGNPAPVGFPGELFIAGTQVGMGYLGRPALTAEKFVPDPFSPEPGARMYRTGDLARWTAEGVVEYLGRLDFQVKVRGLRIELGEIEDGLRRHAAVRDAVVLARGEGEDRRLVAWVAADADPAELRAHLLAHLPEYMVPSVFVMLDALPLTRNGKVDRGALPEPDAADLAGAGYVAPRTPTEEVLAALWAQLLGVGRVGATDGFFELGGHSLLATRLVSRVRADLGVEMPVRAVFEHTTLGALASEVDRLRHSVRGAEAPPIIPVPRDGDLPLSFAQERLWFVDRMEAGSATYHMLLFARLEGGLDADVLRRALDEVVRRHESLRTFFPLVDGIPVQRVAPPAPMEMAFHDLGGLRADVRQDEAERLIREQARLPFWLETGPLFRADLVRLGEGEHLLLATLHHVIADGWSLDVLWHELAALYGAFLRGERSPLPEPRVQYGDFAVWQRAWLRGEVLERQLAFWRRTLEGAPPLLELPADRPRPTVQTHRGGSERAFLPREAADRVLALARKEGSTLFMVLLAALDLVFSRQSGQEDVVVGTPIAGRTRAETDRMVGLFLNSLALRVSLAGDPSFREVLRRVRETTLDAYAHQDVPFEAVLEEIHPERVLDRTPVFQVVLNLANFAGAGAGEAAGDAAESPSGFPGLRVSGVDRGGKVLGAKFDLTLYAGEGERGIALNLVYNSDLFDAGRAAALLAQLFAVLEQAVEDPERPVSRFVLADGRAPSDAGRELRTAAGLPAGVGEPAGVWERRGDGWAATGERGRYRPDGSIETLAAAPSVPKPTARPKPGVPASDEAATETEREMVAIWREVLGVDVGLHDDFFDLGGHSLLGLRLLALVKKRLGRTLGLPVLFTASTPAALSAEVDDTGEGREFVHLVPMGGQESELEPIFLVHPAGGTIFKYAGLARHLGDERPVYAIQAAGVTDGAEPLRTVDLMAARYLEEVRRMQPHGPYFLAGWSAGGVITLEMAHRLRAAGEEVALVGLLDSSPPNAEKPIPDPVHLYRRLAAGLSTADPDALAGLEEEMRGLAIDDRLPHLAKWLDAHGAESRVRELDGLKSVVEVFRANVGAARRHPLAPYPGRVTLFVAEWGRGDGWESQGLPDLWRRYVAAEGEMEVVVVPGTHVSMVNEPYVRGVAAALRAAIAAEPREMSAASG